MLITELVYYLAYRNMQQMMTAAGFKILRKQNGNKNSFVEAQHFLSTIVNDDGVM